MHTGSSELLKTFEASVFAISLILLALAQAPVSPTYPPSAVTDRQAEAVPTQP